jgi:hypothetical protein
MFEIAETAPNCAALSDYQNEATKVRINQGVAFPYTKGFNLIDQLVRVLNPDDFGGLRYGFPLTLKSLNNILGIEHTEQQYRQYFDGFDYAQQNLQGNDFITQLKRSQIWRYFYSDFCRFESATQIPAVQWLETSLYLRRSQGSRQQSEGNRQQSEGSQQQSQGSRQQSEGSRQQSEGNQQQSQGSRQQSEGSQQQSQRSQSRGFCGRLRSCIGL